MSVDSALLKRRPRQRWQLGGEVNLIELRKAK